VWAAENKPLQLATARRLGLIIPETVVTNDPEEIRAAFVRFKGRMIVKPVRTGFVDEGAEQYAVYTNQVMDYHLSKLESARLSPSIYQPLLDKLCDVRVTIVGKQMFVAEIDSQSDAQASVDWRRTSNPELPHRRSCLPPKVAQATLQLMSTLGLEFAALDFVRTPNNEYIFLEVNPNGQWLWLDDQLGFGISAAVAAWLMKTPS